MATNCILRYIFRILRVFKHLLMVGNHFWGYLMVLRDQIVSLTFMFSDGDLRGENLPCIHSHILDLSH